MPAPDLPSLELEKLHQARPSLPDALARHLYRSYMTWHT